MSDDLTYLRARADLTDLINKYATGIDTRNWALYRSIFADEVDICLLYTSPSPRD